MPISNTCYALSFVLSMAEDFQKESVPYTGNTHKKVKGLGKHSEPANESVSVMWCVKKSEALTLIQ